MSGKARAAVLEEFGRIAVREFPIPDIGPRDALLRVEMAGICGTDPKTFHGKMPYTTPMILGHEILGHVEEVGAEAATWYGVKKGDRVVLEGSVPCGSCSYCLGGDYRFCASRRGYGNVVPCTVPPYLWGAYSQYMYIAPGSVVHRISNDVPAEAAVLANGVMANGFQWARLKGGVSIGDTVVVQGAGPQGMACAILSKESGASCVIVTGLARDAERLALCREFGADYIVDVEKQGVFALVRDITQGRMANVVVDVSGSPQAITKSVDLVRRQGTLVLAGLTGKDTVTPMLMDKFVMNEIRLQGVYTKGNDSVAAAIKLIESRKYPLEKIISHKYPLDRAEEAVKAMGGEIPGVYPTKAALVPWG